MVGPGRFEFMGEFLYWSIPSWTPEDDPYSGGAKSNRQPEKILHDEVRLLRGELTSGSNAVPAAIPGWMQTSRAWMGERVGLHW
jgi:hypothetical protein